MNRRIWQRVQLAAVLIVPALVVMAAAWRADAQPGGFRYEMRWKCSKCGGNLGNGVNPPTSCPRCGARLRTLHKTSWDRSLNPNTSRTVETEQNTSSPWGKAIAIAVAALAIVVLGMIIMQDWGPGQTADSKGG